MIYCRHNDNIIQIFRDELLLMSFSCPEKYDITCRRPLLSKDLRYAVMFTSQIIYIYDNSSGSLTELKPKEKHRIITDTRFDQNNRLYYVDGNSVFRWEIGSEKPDLIYNMYRATHGPDNLGVSPDGKYVSFTKYRNSSDFLFVYDTETQTLHDLKISLYHYTWIDNTHIVYTKSGGLKIINLETMKNSTLIKDHVSLRKKVSKADAELLAGFPEKWDISFFSDMDLLGVLDDKIWFTLALRYSEHAYPLGPVTKELSSYAVWNVDISGKHAAFSYDLPEYCRRFHHSMYLTDGGKMAWTKDKTLNLWDGHMLLPFLGQCTPASLFSERCR